MEWIEAYIKLFTLHALQLNSVNLLILAIRYVTFSISLRAVDYNEAVVSLSTQLHSLISG